MAKYLKEKDNTIKISYLGFEGYLEERLAKKMELILLALNERKIDFYSSLIKKFYSQF